MQVGLCRAFGRPLLLGLEDVEQAVDRHVGLAHLGDRAAEPAHRQRQLPRVADKCQIHTQGNLPGHAQVHAQHDDGEHLQDAHHVAQCVKRGHPVAQPEPQVGVAVVLLAELVKLRLLPAERAHHAHARQVLLHDGGQRALRLVRFFIPAGHMAEKQHRITDDHRHKRRRQQRHLHVHREHDDHAGHDHEQRAQQLQQLVHHECAHDLHVGDAALDDVAGAVLHMPAVRQALDAAVQRVAQRLDKPLRAHRQTAVLNVAHAELQQRNRRRQRARRGQLRPRRKRRRKRRQAAPVAQQHAVHREADHLRERHAKQRQQQRRAHAQQESGRRRAQMPRKQPRLLPVSSSHNSPFISSRPRATPPHG